MIGPDSYPYTPGILVNRYTRAVQARVHGLDCISGISSDQADHGDVLSWLQELVIVAPHNQNFEKYDAKDVARELGPIACEMVLVYTNPT